MAGSKDVKRVRKSIPIQPHCWYSVEEFIQKIRDTASGMTPNAKIGVGYYSVTVRDQIPLTEKEVAKKKLALEKRRATLAAKQADALRFQQQRRIETVQRFAKQHGVTIKVVGEKDDDFEIGN